MVALAGRVVDLKISRGLLTEDKKEAELKELSAFSTETLEVLHKELSNVKVTLSENPQPLSASSPTPTPPAAPTAEEKLVTEVEQMRMKLFNHKDEPNEYYQKLKDEGRLW